MEETRREFSKIIQEQYYEYCKSKEIEPSIDGFSKYLINRKVIIDLTVKRFIVVYKYPIALSQNLGSKKLAMWQIEDETGVSYSSIRVYLDRFMTFFRLKNRINLKS